MSELMMPILLLLLGTLITVIGFIGSSVIKWVRRLDQKLEEYIRLNEQRLTRVETLQGIRATKR